MITNFLSIRGLSLRYGGLALLLLLLAGCAAQDIARHLEETQFAYERTIRWGNLLESSHYQKNPETIAESRRQRLKHIKVTGYDVINAQYKPDKVTQLVEIRYYDEDYAVVKTITNRQIWEYDKESEHWYLMTALPRFK